MQQLSKLFKKEFVINTDDINGISIPNPYVGQIIKTPNQAFKISDIDSSGNISFLKMVDFSDLTNSYNDLQSQINVEKNRAISVEGNLTNIDSAFANNNIVSAINSIKNYTDQIKADILDGAPEALDTLKELADSMGDLTDLKGYVDTQIESLHTTIKQEVGTNYVSITDDYTTNIGDYILVDTTNNAITITLPDSPLTNDIIVVKDMKDNAENNSITINGNGNNINGEGTFVINVNGAKVKLLFINNEWLII
jgi:hypothetical protein